jgi:hypothetical protein
VPVRLSVPGDAQPAHFVALISEAIFGGAVGLFDARELSTQQLALIGPHNRVLLSGGSERIVCLPAGAPDGTPLPLPPFLGPQALSEGLRALHVAFPSWSFTLRSGTWEAPPRESGEPAQSLFGWMAEIGLTGGSAPRAAGFHPAPEIALYFAAVEMLDRGPDAGRFGATATRLDALFRGASCPPPEAASLH